MSSVIPIGVKCLPFGLRASGNSSRVPVCPLFTVPGLSLGPTASGQTQDFCTLTVYLGEGCLLVEVRVSVGSRHTEVGGAGGRWVGRRSPVLKILDHIPLLPPTGKYVYRKPSTKIRDLTRVFGRERSCRQSPTPLVGGAGKGRAWTDKRRREGGRDGRERRGDRSSGGHDEEGRGDRG